MIAQLCDTLAHEEGSIYLYLCDLESCLHDCTTVWYPGTWRRNASICISVIKNLTYMTAQLYDTLAHEEGCIYLYLCDTESYLHDCTTVWYPGTWRRMHLSVSLWYWILLTWLHNCMILWHMKKDASICISVILNLTYMTAQLYDTLAHEEGCIYLYPCDTESYLHDCTTVWYPGTWRRMHLSVSLWYWILLTWLHNCMIPWHMKKDASICISVILNLTYMIAQLYDTLAHEEGCIYLYLCDIESYLHDCTTVWYSGTWSRIQLFVFLWYWILLTWLHNCMIPWHMKKDASICISVILNLTYMTAQLYDALAHEEGCIYLYPCDTESYLHDCTTVWYPGTWRRMHLSVSLWYWILLTWLHNCMIPWHMKKDASICISVILNLTYMIAQLYDTLAHEEGCIYLYLCDIESYLHDCTTVWYSGTWSRIHQFVSLWYWILLINTWLHNCVILWHTK